MKIESSKYEGYVWYSNAKEPKIIDNELYELQINEEENPFVLESQLFDGRVSHSIKYVDGKYIQNDYNLEDLSAKTKTEKVYKMNRGGGRELVFNQYWNEVTDKDNCDMPVLVPAELVFVGFKK